MDARRRSTSGETHVLPSRTAIDAARSKLLTTLPDNGLGSDLVGEHVRNDIVPGLNRSSQSPNYYGFVTGGATPAAASADNVVTQTDQNVSVHLPNETVATDVEDRALGMICELLDLDREQWPHRTFTTGATASNVLGLACGREYVLRAARKSNKDGKVASVAEYGIVEAVKMAGLTSIQVLTTVPHSSLRKAASIVGLGRASVIDVGRPEQPHVFDLASLESHLQVPGTGSIVAVSCAEVNTGLFATDGQTMASIRALCDKYGAWLHVDAAFGLLTRVLPQAQEYTTLNAGVAGLELADSITGDAHKLINVPYDCGILLSKHLDLGIDVFQNPNAAYLNTAASGSIPSVNRTVPSPLSIGIENSRRFRALPVYATLAAYGRTGYCEMLERQIALARGIARHMLHSDAYDLLPRSTSENVEDRLQNIYIIVLFRAKDDQLNTSLVERINATRDIHVSPTQWDGQGAVRIAIANWQVDVERDLQLVKRVLTQAAEPC
ncbi:hypothetical protein LTR53_006332 [Teratosphaeriaceae sp. CCFEE 6253]|nr:hypothetical protein LTR53_006332 [Teratosphaeriaceae sp. CCFEE 6253]